MTNLHGRPTDVRHTDGDHPSRRVDARTGFHSTHLGTDTAAVGAQSTTDQMLQREQFRWCVPPHRDTAQSVAVVLRHCVNMQWLLVVVEHRVHRGCTDAARLPTHTPTRGRSASHTTHRWWRWFPRRTRQQHPPVHRCATHQVGRRDSTLRPTLGRVRMLRQVTRANVAQRAGHRCATHEQAGHRGHQ